MILKIVSLMIFCARGVYSSKGSFSISSSPSLVSSASPSSPSSYGFSVLSFYSSSIVAASSSIPIVFMKYAEN